MRPADLDRLFREIEPALRSGSARLALEALSILAERTGRRSDLILPYLEEVMEELPRIVGGRVPTGLDPARLEAVLAMIEAHDMPLGSEERDAIDRLRMQAALVYRWLGAMPGPAVLSRAGLGVGPAARRATDMGAPSGVPSSEGLEDRSAAGRLIEMAERERLRLADGLAVPVVQAMPGVAGGVIGRLRHLSIELSRSAAQDRDRVYAAVALLEDRAESTFAGAAVAAARGLLEQRGLVAAGEHFSGRIRFEESRAVHQGFSADLAIAVLFYLAASRLQERRTQWTLQPGVAITGGLSPEGRVRPVDPVTFPRKIEAAFFSPVNVLVVPAAQHGEALQLVAGLNDHYPNRVLPLLGVDRLEDVFFDTRVVRERRRSAPAYAAGWLWKRKFTLGGVVVLLAMATALGLLLAARIDNNPASARFEGEHLVLRNRYGRDIETFRVGKTTVDKSAEQRHRNVAKPFDLEDVDGDGDNDVCFGSWPSDTSEDGVLSCRPTGSGFDGWSKVITKRLSYPHMPAGGSEQYFARQVDITPCARASGTCLIVNAQHGIYFTSLILKLDAVSGEELASYVHNGTLASMLVSDLGAQRKSRVYFGGTMQHTGDPVLGVLDLAFIEGQSPSEGNHVAEGVGHGLEPYYIRFPLTRVGEVARYLHPYRLVEGLSRENDALLLWLWDASALNLIGAIDTSLPDDAVRAGLSPTLVGRIVERGEASVYVTRLDSLAGIYPLPSTERILAEFDFDMRPLRVWSSSEYDLMADFLYDYGFLDEKPDAGYWEEYRQRIEYWSGDEWATGRVMNRRYLEALGDSL